MNVGIVLPSPKGGGVFQYALSIVESMVVHSRKFNYFLLYFDEESLTFLSHLRLPSGCFLRIPFKAHSLREKVCLLFSLATGRVALYGGEREVRSTLEKYRVGLVIVPFPSLFGFSYEIPYLVSIVDLMHKYYPHFPEFPLRERVARDVIYKNAAKHAVLTIVDDEQGSGDLQRFYGIPQEKIRVIPYIPPGYIYKYRGMDMAIAETVLAKYSLPERFLFYPAHFWYHKNHRRLIEALKFIKQVYGVQISLVLVGYPRESYREAMRFAKESGMSNQIIHLGYVSEKEMVALYKKSVALVFPSLFGPTNIPPLEAMVLGVPVVCSNVFAMPTQLDGAGLLFNPLCVEDMAETIYRIWTDGHLRQELIQTGYQRVTGMTLENYARRWEVIIAEALKKAEG